MAWYNEWFGKDYLEIYKHRDETEAARFINSLENLIGLEKGDKILDLCCGGGRYAIALAEQGYSVSGVDLSEDLLQRARKDAEARKVEVSFTRCDMRRIDFHEEFDLILNMFTSFGYFKTEKEDRKVLRAVYRSLKPGGHFVLDFMNSVWVKNNLKPETVYSKGDKKIKFQRYVLEEKKRVEKDIIIEENGDIKEFRESVRLYTLPELEKLLHETGFTIIKICGDYACSEFGEKSPRLILINKKE